MTLQTWIDDLEAHDIEAGDKVTFAIDSDNDAFDGETPLYAAAEPNDDLWLEIDAGEGQQVVIVPDNDAESGVSIVACSAIRATGILRNRQDIGEVTGIVEVESQ